MSNGFFSQLQEGIEQFGQNLTQMSSVSAPEKGSKQVKGGLAKLHRKVQDDALSPGDRGDDVRLVQGSLKSLGYKITVNGNYDDQTKKAVTRFQKENAIPQSGSVGVSTAQTLYQKIEEQARSGQIIPQLTNLAIQWGAKEAAERYDVPLSPQQQSAGGEETTPTVTPQAQEGINWKPILIGGGIVSGVVILSLFTR